LSVTSCASNINCVVEGGICRKSKCSFTDETSCTSSEDVVNNEPVRPCSWITRVDINDTERGSCAFSLGVSALSQLAAAASGDVELCPETSTVSNGPVVGILVTVLILLTAGLAWIIYKQRMLNSSALSLGRSAMARPLHEDDEMTDL
jgi:hypothetical protein